MSIPDKAVEAARQIVDASPVLLTDDDLRTLLEAAEPYLTGESALRKGLLALTGDLVARAEEGEPHLSLTVRLRDLEALLAAHPEVKS